MKAKKLLLFCLGFFLLSHAYADDLDDLFLAPEPDKVEEAPEKDHLASVAKEEKLKLSGYFEAIGGIGAGWEEWPELQDLGQYFDGSIGFKADANLYVDARPDKDFRFFASFATSINPMDGSNKWTDFKISELFVDYTLLDSIFIRLGQHSTSWGQGKIFTNSNLMADSAGNFSFRAGMPAVLNGIQALILAKQTIDYYKDLIYAAKVDAVFWNTYFSLGARYQADEGIKGLFSIKKVVFGTDLLSDVTISQEGTELDSTEFDFTALAGFFREWDSLKLYGEYLGKGHVGQSVEGYEQKIGLDFGYKHIFGSGFNYGLEYRHEFKDNSGYIINALAWKPWKYITATLALPLVYGPTGAFYVTEGNPDLAKRRIALLFGLEMKVNF